MSAEYLPGDVKTEIAPTFHEINYAPLNGQYYRRNGSQNRK
jgi:hypothetical protein